MFPTGAAHAEQPVAPAEAAPADEPATGTVVGETGEEIDLEKISASAIALLHVAVVGAVAVVLVLLWGQFFAALSILDEVGLWGYAATVDGKEVSATVSVLDLLGALLVLVLGFVLAKGLPALLGIVLIGFVTRKGLLFAIQTVISYVVGTIGVVAALQMLGFGWSKLQWMAAGLSQSQSGGA